MGGEDLNPTPVTEAFTRILTFQRSRFNMCSQEGEKPAQLFHAKLVQLFDVIRLDCVVDYALHWTKCLYLFSGHYKTDFRTLLLICKVLKKNNCPRYLTYSHKSRQCYANYHSIKESFLMSYTGNLNLPVQVQVISSEKNKNKQKRKNS